MCSKKDKNQCGAIEGNVDSIFFSYDSANKQTSLASCSPTRLFALSLLAYRDSNLDWQNQNLMCYHYTIRQCFDAGAKVMQVFVSAKVLFVGSIKSELVA